MGLSVATQRQHKARVSMMPVEGDNNARSAISAGSSARFLAAKPDEIEDAIDLGLGS